MGVLLFPPTEGGNIPIFSTRQETGSALEIWLAPKASSQETQHHGEGNGQNWVI